MENKSKRLLCSWQEFTSITPKQLQESRDQNNGKVILKGILQKADTLNQNGRIYPKNILEREVDNYQKYILERRATGQCVPPGTEIFTKDGWKKIEDISETETIYTLDLNNQQIELQQITQKVVLSFNGNLLRFHNHHSYDMCVTPDHKVLAWNRKNQPFSILASDLKSAYEKNDSSVSHSYIRRAGVLWNGENPEFVTVANKEVDATLWMAFLGIYLAEGHSSGTKSLKSKHKHCVVVTQNSGSTCDEIRNLMQQLPWKFIEQISKNGKRHDFCIRDKDLHTLLFELGDSRQKYIPEHVKQYHPQLLQILLDWLLLGDGRHRISYGKMVNEYCTVSTKLASDVAELMFKLGKGATIHVQDRHSTDHPSPDKDRIILGKNCADMNIVYQHESKTMSLNLGFMQVEEIPYEGNVYCVTVPNSTWLMRYNNKVCWTHNCDHPDDSVVALKEVSHNVIKTWWEGNVVWGLLEVLNTPNGKIIQTLLEDGIKLGISSRGVGSTEKEGDYCVVQDDFQLICWDMVSEPSTPGAFMLPEHAAYMPEGKELKFNDAFYENNQRIVPPPHAYQNTIDLLLSLRQGK